MAEKMYDTWFCRQPGGGGNFYQHKEDAEWAAGEFNRGGLSFAGQKDVKKVPYIVERHKSDHPNSGINKENVERWKRGY